MSNSTTPHFREEYLIQYVDGELKKQEALNVQEHLEACWRCRAVLADLQQTITEYVSCLDECNGLIPEPPQPWSGFHLRLDRLAAQRQMPWWRRAGGSLSGFLPGFLSGFFSGRRIRLATIAATILLVAGVTVFELNRPVRAAELLSRAVAHEALNTAPRAGILIRTMNRGFTRPAILAVGAAGDSQSELPNEIRDLFQSAAYSWEDPLSARSFTAWHDRLPERSDNVDEMETGQGLKVFRVRTSTRSSSLEEATLRFRTDDYSVVSGAFRFKNNSWIEMEIISLPPEHEAPASPESSAKAVIPRMGPPAGADEPASSEPDLSTLPARELRVFAALRDMGADLGEQIEMARGERGNVVVSATGLPPERRETLRRSLAGMPGVDVHFIEPGSRQPANESARAPGPDATIAPSALQLRIERAIGGELPMERLTDQILEASAGATARAHALRKLAEWFPPEVESGLDTSDQAILRRLRNDHADALVRSAEEIRRIVQPVFSSLSVPWREAMQPAAHPVTWQAATQPLLDTASRADRLLTMIVTGTGGNSSQETVLSDAAGAVQQLAAEAASYKLMVNDSGPERR